MNDQQWAYKSKWRVSKAVFFTLLFHTALLFAIAAASGTDFSNLIPDFLKPLDTENQIAKEKKSEDGVVYP